MSLEFEFQLGMIPRAFSAMRLGCVVYVRV